MSTEVYEGGELRERWDDATRTVTTWDENGEVIDTRPFTTDENAAADEDARQNAMILDLEGRISALEAYVFAATPPNPEGVPWTATDWPPGSVVTHSGEMWANQTGQWLNGSYLPGDAAHPFWTLLPRPGETVTPWATGMHLIPQMLVSNLGKTFRYLGTDTPSAPANWAPTVSNATWQEIT